MKYSAADVSARTPTCFSSTKRNASSESNTLSDTRSRDLTVWVTWVGVSSLGQRPPPPPYRHTTSSAVRAAAKTDYDDLPCLPSPSCFSLEAVTLLSGLFFFLPVFFLYTYTSGLKVAPESKILKVTFYFSTRQKKIVSPLGAVALFDVCSRCENSPGWNE